MGADYTVGGLFVNWPIADDPGYRQISPLVSVIAMPLEIDGEDQGAAIAHAVGQDQNFKAMRLIAEHCNAFRFDFLIVTARAVAERDP